MINFSFVITNIFCSFPEKHFFFISGASPDINIHLPQERIDALISAGVFHANVNDARDVDNICNPLAMQCLTGYALRPSFIDPAYSTAIVIANQEIKRLWKTLSDNYDIAQQHDVRYSICRAPEQARIEELMDHIRKLESSAQGKSNSRAVKSSPITKEHSKRTKRATVKVPSGKPTSKAHLSPSSFPSSEEEDDNAAPPIFKRKRPNPEQSSLAPRPTQNSSTLSTATPSAFVSRPALLSSGHIPNPDPEDHLTLKKLKASHPQETTSQPQISVQTSTSIQPDVNTQSIPSQPVNIQPNPSQFTVPYITLTSIPEIVNIEDSNEE